jgi:signal transduction histidine kinase
MTLLLRENLEYAVLAASFFVPLAAAAWWLRRRGAGGGWPIPAACIAIVAVGVVGFFAVNRAQQDEEDRLRQLLVGFAPTFASELEAMGHASVTFDTRANDPTYLKLIEAQKRWLAVNPLVADVYTLRRRGSDGRFAFVVDSETDYNHNGKIDAEEEREQRTAIGEVYEDEDNSLSRSWDGETVFSPEPYADRWGTWVSASVPMRDANGNIEAVCGVDYPAEEWLAHVETARRGAWSFVAATLCLIEAAAVVAALQRARVKELKQRVAERERAAADLARAKAAADAANHAKSAFLANMSHELRTPMTAVLGFADLLRHADAKEAERNEWIDVIVRNGNHLLKVINDILDLSKIEAEKMTLEQLEISPSGLLDEVAALMRVRAAEKGLTLHVTGGDKLAPKLLLDPTRVKQVLVNLVGNAIKFTTAGGAVAIDARYQPSDSSQGTLILAVRDSGIGMSDEVIARLFQPFEQADASTTRQFGGTGLGLTISRRLIEMMGGRITVTSAVGKGSTFTIELPARVAKDELRRQRAA